MGKDLNYIINHVFLPPKLPQKNDSDATRCISLIKELLEALTSFQANIPEQEVPGWNPCIEMLSNMLDLRDHLGGLVPEKVQTTFENMMDKGVN
jgi:hypothetical protein